MRHTLIVLSILLLDYLIYLVQISFGLRACAHDKMDHDHNKDSLIAVVIVVTMTATAPMP